MTEDIDQRLSQLAAQKKVTEEIFRESRTKIEEWEKKALNIKIPGLGFLIYMTRIGYPKKVEKAKSESLQKRDALHREIESLIGQRPGKYPLSEIQGSLVGSRNQGVVFSYNFEFKIEDDAYKLGFQDNSLTLQEGEVDQPTLKIGNDGNKVIILPENGKIIIGGKDLTVGGYPLRGYYSPPNDNTFAYWQPAVTDKPQKMTFALREDMEWVKDHPLEIRTYSDTKIVAE